MYALHFKQGPITTYTDQRFKRYTEYAGVRAFYRALAGKYTKSCDFRKVHVLSARNEMTDETTQKLTDILGGTPYDFTEGSGDWTPGTDPHYYVRGAYEKDGDVHYVKGAIKAFLTRSGVLDREKFAEVKVGNFKGFLETKILSGTAQHPHDKAKDIIVWNGDNGQGDMCTAQQVMQFAEEKGLKMLAFIHKASEHKEFKCNNLVTPKFDFDELVKQKKIIFYWTYPDLAVKLIRDDGTFYGQVFPQAAYDEVLAEAQDPPTDGAGGSSVESFGIPQCQKLFANCRVSRARKVYKCGSHGKSEQIEYCKKLQEALPEALAQGWPTIAREE